MSALSNVEIQQLLAMNKFDIDETVMAWETTEGIRKEKAVRVLTLAIHHSFGPGPTYPYTDWHPAPLVFYCFINRQGIVEHISTEGSSIYKIYPECIDKLNTKGAIYELTHESFHEVDRQVISEMLASEEQELAIQLIVNKLHI